MVPTNDHDDEVYSRMSAGVRPYRTPLSVTITCSVIRVWLVVA